MFSVRFVTADHYLATPNRQLDVCYSEFRGSLVNKVPVVRIFGSTPNGQKTCMHVHGAFPYIMVPYDADLCSSVDLDNGDCDRFCRLLAVSLDKAINVALGSSKSTNQHVFKITAVSGIPFYGYNKHEKTYLRIFFYNPAIVRKAVDLLQNGAIMNHVFQPHEAHVPYVLQMCIDHNLHGMNMVNVSRFKFRGCETSTKDQSLCKSDSCLSVTSPTFSSGSSSDFKGFCDKFDKDQRWDVSNISDENLRSDLEKQSNCELEVDVLAQDITNRLELDAMIDEYMNPGLHSIWEDERNRKRLMMESSQITPPNSQDRVNVKPTDSEMFYLDRWKHLIHSDESLLASNEPSQPLSPSICSTPSCRLDLHRSIVDGDSVVEKAASKFDGEPVVNEEVLQKFAANENTNNDSMFSQDLVELLADMITGKPELENANLTKIDNNNSETDDDDEEQTVEMSQIIWDDRPPNDNWRDSDPGKIPQVDGANDYKTCDDNRTLQEHKSNNYSSGMQPPPPQQQQYPTYTGGQSYGGYYGYQDMWWSPAVQQQDYYQVPPQSNIHPPSTVNELNSPSRLPSFPNLNYQPNVVRESNAETIGRSQYSSYPGLPTTVKGYNGFSSPSTSLNIQQYNYNQYQPSQNVHGQSPNLYYGGSSNSGNSCRYDNQQAAAASNPSANYNYCNNRSPHVSASQPKYLTPLCSIKNPTTEKMFPSYGNNAAAVGHPPRKSGHEDYVHLKSESLRKSNDRPAAFADTRQSISPTNVSPIKSVAPPASMSSVSVRSNKPCANTKTSNLKSSPSTPGVLNVNPSSVPKTSGVLNLKLSPITPGVLNVNPSSVPKTSGMLNLKLSPNTKTTGVINVNPSYVPKTSGAVSASIGNIAMGVARAHVPGFTPASTSMPKSANATDVKVSSYFSKEKFKDTTFDSEECKTLSTTSIKEILHSSVPSYSVCNVKSGKNKTSKPAVSAKLKPEPKSTKKAQSRKKSETRSATKLKRNADDEYVWSISRSADRGETARNIIVRPRDRRSMFPREDDDVAELSGCGEDPAKNKPIGSESAGTSKKCDGNDDASEESACQSSSNIFSRLFPSADSVVSSEEHRKTVPELITLFGCEVKVSDRLSSEDRKKLGTEVILLKRVSVGREHAADPPRDETIGENSIGSSPERDDPLRSESNSGAKNVGEVNVSQFIKNVSKKSVKRNAKKKSKERTPRNRKSVSRTRMANDAAKASDGVSPIGLDFDDERNGTAEENRRSEVLAENVSDDGRVFANVSECGNAKPQSDECVVDSEAQRSPKSSLLGSGTTNRIARKEKCRRPREKTDEMERLEESFGCGVEASEKSQNDYFDDSDLDEYPCVSPQAVPSVDVIKPTSPLKKYWRITQLKQGFISLKVDTNIGVRRSRRLLTTPDAFYYPPAEDKLPATTDESPRSRESQTCVSKIGIESSDDADVPVRALESISEPPALRPIPRRRKSGISKRRSNNAAKKSSNGKPRKSRPPFRLSRSETLKICKNVCVLVEQLDSSRFPDLKIDLSVPSVDRCVQTDENGESFETETIYDFLENSIPFSNADDNPNGVTTFVQNCNGPNARSTSNLASSPVEDLTSGDNYSGVYLDRVYSDDSVNFDSEYIRRHEKYFFDLRKNSLRRGDSDDSYLCTKDVLWNLSYLSPPLSEDFSSSPPQCWSPDARLRDDACDANKRTNGETCKDAVSSDVGELRPSTDGKDRWLTFSDNSDNECGELNVTDCEDDNDDVASGDPVEVKATRVSSNGCARSSEFRFDKLKNSSRNFGVHAAARRNPVAASDPKGESFVGSFRPTEFGRQLSPDPKAWNPYDSASFARRTDLEPSPVLDENRANESGQVSLVNYLKYMSDLTMTDSERNEMSGDCDFGVKRSIDVANNAAENKTESSSHGEKAVETKESAMPNEGVGRRKSAKTDREEESRSETSFENPTTGNIVEDVGDRQQNKFGIDHDRPVFISPVDGSEGGSSDDCRDIVDVPAEKTIDADPVAVENKSVRRNDGLVCVLATANGNETGSLPPRSEKDVNRSDFEHLVTSASLSEVAQSVSDDASEKEPASSDRKETDGADESGNLFGERSNVGASKASIKEFCLSNSGRDDRLADDVAGNDSDDMLTIVSENESCRSSSEADGLSVSADYGTLRSLAGNEGDRSKTFSDDTPTVASKEGRRDSGDTIRKDASDEVSDLLNEILCSRDDGCGGSRDEPDDAAVEEVDYSEDENERHSTQDGEFIRADGGDPSVLEVSGEMSFNEFDDSFGIDEGFSVAGESGGVASDVSIFPDSKASTEEREGDDVVDGSRESVDDVRESLITSYFSDDGDMLIIDEAFQSSNDGDGEFEDDIFIESVDTIVLSGTQGPSVEPSPEDEVESDTATWEKIDEKILIEASDVTDLGDRHPSNDDLKELPSSVDEGVGATSANVECVDADLDEEDVGSSERVDLNTAVLYDEDFDLPSSFCETERAEICSAVREIVSNIVSDAATVASSKNDSADACGTTDDITSEADFSVEMKAIDDDPKNGGLRHVEEIVSDFVQDAVDLSERREDVCRVTSDCTSDSQTVSKADDRVAIDGNPDVRQISEIVSNVVRDACLLLQRTEDCSGSSNESVTSTVDYGTDADIEGSHSVESSGDLSRGFEKSATVCDETTSEDVAANGVDGRMAKRGDDQEDDDVRMDVDDLSEGIAVAEGNQTVCRVDVTPPIDRSEKLPEITGDATLDRITTVGVADNADDNVRLEYAVAVVNDLVDSLLADPSPSVVSDEVGVNSPIDQSEKSPETSGDTMLDRGSTVCVDVEINADDNTRQEDAVAVVNDLVDACLSSRQFLEPDERSEDLDRIKDVVSNIVMNAVGICSSTNPANDAVILKDRVPSAADGQRKIPVRIDLRSGDELTASSTSDDSDNRSSLGLPINDRCGDLGTPRSSSSSRDRKHAEFLTEFLFGVTSDDRSTKDDIVPEFDSPTDGDDVVDDSKIYSFYCDESIVVNDEDGNDSDVVMRYAVEPPEAENVVGTMSVHGLSDVEHRDVFCSKAEDVPQATEVGGIKLSLSTNDARDLCEYESNFGGLEKMREIGSDSPRTESVADDDQRRVVIAPCKRAPSRRTVLDWLRKREEIESANGNVADRNRRPNKRPIEIVYLEGIADARCVGKERKVKMAPESSGKRTRWDLVRNVSDSSATSLTCPSELHSERDTCPNASTPVGRPGTVGRRNRHRRHSTSEHSYEFKRRNVTMDETYGSQSRPSLRQKVLNSQFKNRFLTPRKRRSSLGSPIEGPTPDNTFNFRIPSVRRIQSTNDEHQYQHLTTMSLEIHIETRGDLRPDPEFDAVLAIFYKIHQDVPARPNGEESCGIIVLDRRSDVANCAEESSVGSRPDRERNGGNPNGSSSAVEIKDLRNNLSSRFGLTGLEFKYVETEVEMFSELVETLIRYDPDILVGYEIQMLSWGYLIDRASHLNVNLCPRLSRVPNSENSSRSDEDLDRYGADHMSEIHIAGRIVLNAWRIFRGKVTLNIYSFENVYYHIVHERIPAYSFESLTSWFSSSTSNFSKRWKTIEYYVTRVIGTIKMLGAIDLIGQTSELARVFGLQFYEVLTRGSQLRVESLLLRSLRARNFVAVSPSIRQRAMSSAPEYMPLVMEPESRFYKDPVVVLDFQSLYPSICIAYNYCYSTCLGKVDNLGSDDPFKFGCLNLTVNPALLRELENDVAVSPSGHAFVKDDIRRGILPQMLSEILSTRIMVKKAMKDYKDDKGLQRLLGARQLGLKYIANFTYGYTSANFSGRMPCTDVADSIVSKARETLERAIRLVETTEKWNAKVVYGDTDSLFVRLSGRTKAQAFAIGSEIAEAVTSQNPKPVKLKFEKVYLPCVLQTKKRYVGYMWETPEQQRPIYDAKGIETVRRDSCPIVAKMLQKSLETLFESRDVSRVKQYVQRQFYKIQVGTASLQDFIFAKEYRGKDSYRPGACVPALHIARKLMQTDRRAEPRVGERVPYVIVYDSPGLPLIQLVRTPRQVLEDPSIRINSNYYITRVIIPPLNRALSLIGIDARQWFAEMPRINKLLLPNESAANTSKKGTISQYFNAIDCIVCDERISATRDRICAKCRSNPQIVSLDLRQKIRTWERSYDDVLKVCRSCTGWIDRRSECVSLDCPNTFKLIKTRREHSQCDYVRSLLESLQT
ncbi:REV3L (predicted) [Pycnogonum litorale]